MAGFCWFHELIQLCLGSDQCQSWSNGAGGRGGMCQGKKRSSGTSLSSTGELFRLILLGEPLIPVLVPFEMG